MNNIDFQEIEKEFLRADSDRLLEHSFYRVLESAGIDAPAWFFLGKNRELSQEVISGIPGEQAVLKIVSPLIIHKSEAGGVRFVPKDFSAVKAEIESMLDEVPGRYRNWIQQDCEEISSLSLEEIQSSIKGVLITEAVEYQKTGYGTELLLGIRQTREFGPVVTLGGGGLDVEYMAEQLKAGRAQAVSAAHAAEKEIISPRLKSLAVYAKLTENFRGSPPLISAEKLEEIYFRFLKLAEYFSAFTEKSEFVIEEAEINPLVIREGKLIPLDGMCRISRNKRFPDSRPVHQIRHLLKPRSIAVVGVSRSLNPGHIILNNILAAGFPRKKICVIKPECDEVEGCRCFPDAASLPETVDLLVLAVGAKQSRDIIREVIHEEKARSVILIAGGMGEKKGGENLEEDIQKAVSRSRKQKKITPMINGGNCLGIVSRPGKYDTTFIPKYKIFFRDREEASPSGLVLISQSGAFMISRISQMPMLQLRYAVSIGNQIDLTISDYLNYLKDDPDSRVFGVYAEGFKPGDGLKTAQAVRDITKQGKFVVLYKAGRTREGRSATAGHTASVAGDYQVSVDVLGQSGAFIAEDIQEFQILMQSLSFLKDKKVRGRKAALVSNAGFECVIMSDNLSNQEKLELADFSSVTRDSLIKILKPLGIDRLQDIKNPLDTTPIADDRTFIRCVEVILQDKNIDCAVVSPLPMTPSMNTLASSPEHDENAGNKDSIGQQLADLFQRMDKPWVVSLDAGKPYQALREMLEQAGVPVFSQCDQAAVFLRKYINHLI